MKDNQEQTVDPQWRIQGFPSSRPPGRPKWGRKWRNLRKNERNYIQKNEDRLRRCSYFAHPVVTGWLRPCGPIGHCDSIWVSVQLAKCKKILLGAFYQPPSKPHTKFTDQLDLSLSRMTLDKVTIVCLAALSWKKELSTQMSPEGSSRPYKTTRWNNWLLNPPRGRNTLDLFLTTHPTLVNKVTMTPGISDHDGIPMIDLSTKPKKKKKNLLIPQSRQWDYRTKP